MKLVKCINNKQFSGGDAETDLINNRLYLSFSNYKYGKNGFVILFDFGELTGYYDHRRFIDA
jgi:hypothetical protein